MGLIDSYAAAVVPFTPRSIVTFQSPSMGLIDSYGDLVDAIYGVHSVFQSPSMGLIDSYLKTC